MDCGCDAPSIGPSLANTCGAGQSIIFMTLLNWYITDTCDISEICNRVKPTISPDQVYDFVVIGGGSGGSAAAGRLAEIPGWKVLLIEAGGDEPPGSQVPSMLNNYHGTEFDWKYKTGPEPNACLGNPEHKCKWPRAKVLGGCSVINGMMYTRGTPKDYDHWSELGNTGWSYKAVLPYFVKSENNLEIGTVAEEGYHGRDGPITVTRFPSRPEMADDILSAGKDLGYPITNDLNGAQYTGFTIAQTSSR